MNPPNAVRPQDPLLDNIRLLTTRATQTGQFAKLADKVQRLVDSRLPQVTPGPVDCKVGCDYCCHRRISATLPEVLAIAEHVNNTFTEDERSTLLERLVEYDIQLMETYRLRSAITPQPCPFLRDHECSIYQIRPISCRGSLSPDANLCKQWLDGEINLPMYAPPLAFTGAVSQAISAASLEAGAPSGVLEFTSAVGCALKESHRALERVNGTAPIEKSGLLSAQNDGYLHPSNALKHRLEDPGLAVAWESSVIGDTKRIESLAPALRDQASSVLLDLCLPSMYESQDELEATWAKLEQAVTNFENFTFAPASTYEILGLPTIFYWAYAGKDVRPLMQRLKKKMLDEIVIPAHPELTGPLPDKRKPGKFRLGYIGGLFNSSGSRWATGWLENHAPEIETYAFNVMGTEDDSTNFWRRTADHYFHLPFAAAEVAALIRTFDLDAMIFPEIGIGRCDNQYSCFRLARRQFTAWGHPATSGSRMIDGYLSSELMEPSDGDKHYTERLYRLPGSGLCYPRKASRVEPANLEGLGLPKAGFLFNAQNPAKNLPKHDQLFREIGEASGKPIAFIAPHHEKDRARFERRLMAAGVNAVILPRMDLGSYLGVVAAADALLDPPGYNGGHSTVDALTLGRPVISLSGEFMRGRQSLAFLNIAGVGGLIAKDEQDYVQLALDLNRQQKAMANLNADALYDDRAPVSAIDEILLNGG